MASPALILRGTPPPPGVDDSMEPTLAALDLAFLAAWRGVDTRDEAQLETLRSHVLSTWRAALPQLYVYRCVRSLGFLKPRLPHYPGYAALLELARARGADFRLADVG